MKPRWHLVIIFLVGFLLYFPSLFGQFIWDDEDFVYANRYVQQFEISNLFTHSLTSGRDKESNYFRPVQGTIYAATYQAVGPNPFWFHLLNILAHTGAACAIFYFFKIILEKSARFKFLGAQDLKEERAPKNESSTWIALLISLFFLIHPVQTEAVSYISGLSDPLYVLFGFLSLIFFLLRDERKNMIPLSLFFFILSVLSKETGLVFLPLIFLLDWKKSWSFFIAAISYLWYHFSFINNFDIKSAWGNGPYANSLLVRLLTFVQNLYLYMSLLLFPKDLFMERDYSISVQTNFFNIYLALFLITNVTILAAIRKSKILIFCFLAFYASFIPYTGAVLINGIFYEHFLYLPLVFFFAFWTIVIASASKAISSKHLRSFVSFILFTLLILFSWRNLSRQRDWIDPIRFYS